jgi:hypothetical protein
VCRSFLILGAVALFVLTMAGCGLHHGSPRSTAETEKQLIESENLDDLKKGWRGWAPPDQPDELTPYRIHGGVGPASSSIF